MLLSVAGLAQSSKDDAIVIKDKVIKMPKYPLADFLKKSTPLSEIQIVQFVKDSVWLGYVLKGMDDQVARLVSSKPLTQFLQEHIEKMYGNDYKKEGRKMLWVLRNLRVAEKSTTFSQYAYLNLKIDSYLEKNEGNYQRVAAIDSVFIYESMGDVTAWHGTNIENVFKLLLKQSFQVIDKNMYADSEVVTLAQISSLSGKNIEKPILTTDKYNEGAYASFAEFAENKPGIINYEPIVLQRKKAKYIVGFKNERNDTISVWGLCKNGELYRYYESQLIPIEKQGGGFIISDYVAKTNRRNSNAFAAALMGGLAGGLVGGTAAGLYSSGRAGGAVPVTFIPYISNRKKQPDASVLDMDTGEFSF